MQVFLDYFTPELVVELNARSPNLLEDIILVSNHKVVKLSRKLINLGVEVTVRCSMNSIITDRLFVFHNLIRYASGKVKRQLKHSIPNSYQLPPAIKRVLQHAY